MYGEEFKFLKICFIFFKSKYTGFGLKTGQATLFFKNWFFYDLLSIYGHKI